MTLLTRGKKPVTFKIPDDTDDAYARYKGAVKHIAVDRQDTSALAEALSDKAFDGAPRVTAGHTAAAHLSPVHAVPVLRLGAGAVLCWPGRHARLSF